MSDHTRWGEVDESLKKHFTVYAIDRRGRGQSGDGPAYSMARECEDAIAVLKHIDRPTTAIGHSYGADIALDSALMTDRITHLLLYEPGILEGVRGYYAGAAVAAALDEAEALLDEGRPEDAVITILRKVVEVSDDDLEMLRASAAWPNRVAAAHTVLCEIRAEGSWMFDPARYADLQTPILLLTGSESYQIARDGTSAHHEALPNSRIAMLEGQGHVAMTTAPDLFVREVIDFLIR